MSDTARITVTSGPDKGRVYELTGEMIRLGRSPDNNVVFTDSHVGEQHASIICRDGRFAIHTLLADGLEIDGTEVPPERWVWLPELATIRVGRRTSVEFTSGNGANADSDDSLDLEPAKTQAGQYHAGETAAPRMGSSRPPVGSSGPVAVVAGTPAVGRPAEARQTDAKVRRPTETTAPGSDVQPRPKKSSTERGDKKGRTLARFITDGPGDPLVKLGEDGRLPELNLHETLAGERQEAGPKQSNSGLLMLVLGVSFGLTMLMLFMDASPFEDSQEAKNRARREIAMYYGAEGETLKPYQDHLREAQRARSRRDYEAERKEYKYVFSLLRSETKDKLNKYTGLTGQIDYEPSSDKKKSDKRLEELISILLGE